MRLQTIQTNTVRVIAMMAALTLAISSKATVPVSDLPDFDNLPNFAQLGNQITVHNATVNGNEGVSEDGLLDLDNPGTINGNVYVANGATFNQVGTVTGAVFTAQNLTTEQSTVFSASSALAALTPDQTITTDQTAGLSFDIPAGQIFVLNLNGGLDLHNNNITLTGGGDLVLNIMSSFNLSGSASILGAPPNIFVNYLGTGMSGTKAGDVVDGQVFLPNAGADFRGLWNGAIYSGDENVTLMSEAVLNGVPVPEPGIALLSGFGGISIILLLRRKAFGFNKTPPRLHVSPRAYLTNVSRRDD